MVFKLFSSSYPAGGGAIVALMLAEKNVPFEFVEVNMQEKQQKSPEHMAMHPFGQVPVINDDGFILYETRAICRYLEDKYPSEGAKLAPTELKAKALFEQAASVEFANFYPAVMKVVSEALGNPRNGLPVDQVKLAELVKELVVKLDVYEVILGKQKYVAGNEVTIVDFFHLMYAPLLAGGGVDVMTSESRPNVARWWNELISRPTWVKLVADGTIKGTVN